MLVGHLAALHFFWYWYLWWFDIPMHILGGMALGALGIAVFGKRAALFMLWMIVVVLGWEAFEFAARISTGQFDYWIDTISDIANGLIGGSIMYLLAKK